MLDRLLQRLDPHLVGALLFFLGNALGQVQRQGAQNLHLVGHPHPKLAINQLPHQQRQLEDRPAGSSFVLDEVGVQWADFGSPEL